MCVRYSTCADPRPTPRRTAGQGARPPATGFRLGTLRRRISERGVLVFERGGERIKGIGVSPCVFFHGRFRGIFQTRVYLFIFKSSVILQIHLTIF